MNMTGEVRMRVLREHRACLEARVMQRQRAYEAQKHRLALFNAWGIENAETRRRERAEWEEQAKIVERRLEEEEERTREAERRAARAEDWRNGHELTQETLSMMRRYGTLPGVNRSSAPAGKDVSPKESSPQIMVKLIRCDGEGGELADGLGWAKVTLKDPDLKVEGLGPFPKVASVRCERLGLAGARILARELAPNGNGGLCSRLETLDLGWNGICAAGFESLIYAFGASGKGGALVRLDVRANHINGDSMTALRSTLEGGGLPRLAHLDLRHNPLKDEGAKALAHMALSGLLRSVETLNATGCEVRDGGMRAFYSAFCAASLPSLMPKVKLVTARDNRPSPALMRMCRQWPPFVQV